jgi:hypothetical protein
MAQRQGGGDDGDGQFNGNDHHATAMRYNSNRRCYRNATAMMSMDGRNSNGNGRHKGGGNGWRNGDGNGEMTATKLMDGATATVTAMDGGTAMGWQQKAQWQYDGDNVDGLHSGDGDGRHNGDGDGRCNNEVVAMTVMDGAMATAIA